MGHQGATAAIKNILEQLELKAEYSVPAPQNVETGAATLDAAADASRKQSGPTTSLGAVVDALDERAFGILLLLLALPCCVPFIYGLPQIVAVPILILAGQLAMGRTAPLLPQKLREKSFPIAPLKTSVSKAEKYLGWFERIAAPRLRTLTDGVGLRIVGAVMLIPAASILLPLPSTNTIPGIGVTILAVGLIERDGLMVLLGLLIGFAWVAFLVFLFLFFGFEAVSHAKEILKSGFGG